MGLNCVMSSVCVCTRSWGDLPNYYSVLSDVRRGDVMVASRRYGWGVSRLGSVGEGGCGD